MLPTLLVWLRLHVITLHVILHIQKEGVNCTPEMAGIKDANDVFLFTLKQGIPVNLRDKTAQKNGLLQTLHFKEMIGRWLFVNPAPFFLAACHESCSSCWGAAENNCLACKDPSHMLKAGLCVVSCGQGFYTKGGICSGKYLFSSSNCRKFEKCSAKKESIFHLAVQQLWFCSRLRRPMHLVHKYQMRKAAVCKIINSFKLIRCWKV